MRLPVKDDRGKWRKSQPGDDAMISGMTFEGYENVSDLEADEFDGNDGATDEEESEVPRPEVISEDDEPEESHPSDKKEDFQVEFSTKKVEDRRIIIGKLCTEIIEEGGDLLVVPKLKKLLSLTKYTLAKLKNLIAHPEAINRSDSKKNKNLQNEWQDSATLLLVGGLAVFQDIAPDYMIRILTETEKAEKVSKDVKIQREFEQSLVHYYKAFLTLLFNVVVKPGTRGNGTKKNAPFGGKSSTHQLQDRLPINFYLVAVKCFFEILCSGGTLNAFNYHEEIVSFVVFIGFTEKRMQVATLVQKYFERIFKEVDSNGRLTAIIVREASDLISTHKYAKMPFCLLASFLAVPTTHILPLQSRDLRNLRKKDGHKKEDSFGKKHAGHVKKRAPQVHVTKKNKKIIKEEKLWKKELEESEMTLQHSTLQKWHHETLQYLFRIYIGFLKKSPPHLFNTMSFEACLRGLCLFAPFIQGNFLDDLLLTLKQLLINNEGTYAMKLSIKLLCIQTQFCLSQYLIGVTLDLFPLYKSFYGFLADFLTLLYGSFDGHPVFHVHRRLKEQKKATKSILDTWKTPAASSYEDEPIELIYGQLLESFECFFLKKNIALTSIPLPRLASFLHRLAFIALHLKDPSKLLNMLVVTFTKFPKICFLLSTSIDSDSDEDFFAAGIFDPKNLDPDHANGHAFPLGALIELLAFNHSEIGVRDRAKALLKMHA